MAATDIIQDQIRRAMADNLGIKATEIASVLGISKTTAARHMRAIRAEWKKREGGEG